MPYLEGPKVDPSDVMPDGRRFRNIDEFKQLLLKDKDQLARALAEKLLTYATGAASTTADRPEVEALRQLARQDRIRLRALCAGLRAVRLIATGTPRQILQRRHGRPCTLDAISRR